jgi:hypothetical protein
MVKEKCTAKPTEGKTTPQYKKKKVLFLQTFIRTVSLLQLLWQVSTSSLPAGIAADRLLGPYFLPPRLTGAVYRDFLRKALPELLQDMGPQTGIRLWFVHDGHLPYFLIAVREFLNSKLPERWIRKRLNNSVASLFTWLQSLTFLSQETSQVHCLRYSSQWSPRLATTNTERILYASYDTWNFFGESSIHCTNVQRPALKLKVDTFCIQHYFLLYCGPILPSVGLAVNFSLTLYIIYTSWKYIEYFLRFTWFLDCIHRLMFQRYTPSPTGKNSSFQRSRISR